MQWRGLSRAARRVATRRALLPHVVAATLAVVLTAGGVALANHTHTTYGIHYHGIGDGANSNNYTHPFINENDGVAGFLRIDVYRWGQRTKGSGHYGRHHHYDDRSIVECGTAARIGADNRRSPMKVHTNYHHNYCFA